jgi:uncharacterized protein (DUF305 family)
MKYLILSLGLLGSGAASAQDASAERFEARFLASMSDHHAGAVRMADACVARAESDALRAMCEEMSVMQRAEVEAMSTWLDDWYGVSPALDPNPVGLDRLQRLQGARFDAAFLRAMIVHHDEALPRARQCADRAVHDELAAACADMVEMQTLEIEEMKTMLCEDYDYCDGPRS